MGVLSKPKTTHAPIFFSGSNAPLMKPKAHKFILDLLHNIVPKRNIRAAHVMGSITGYKYDTDSDVDVSVYVQPSTDGIDPDAYAQFLHTLTRRQLNGTMVPGTTHPINFYIKNHFPELAQITANSDYGVFNLLTNNWIVEPTRGPDELRDPKNEFPIELQIAKFYQGQFGRAVTKTDVESLVRLTKNIKQNREDTYASNWGIPRRSFANILYKTFEKGPYHEVFGEAKKLERARRKSKERKRETYIHKKAASLGDYAAFLGDWFDHKKKVYKAGRKLGAPRGQLLMHDMDKLDPRIMGPYTKFFFEKDRSFEAMRSFTMAAGKHKRRNAHHVRPTAKISSQKPVGILLPVNVRKEIMADWYASQTRREPNLTLNKFMSRMK
jgi:hypothetical protein